MAIRPEQRTVTCTACTASIDAGSRFCSQCGTPLETASDGSVRVVTALFADMVSSVEHTAAADPEAAADLVQQVVNAMTTAVLDHGGEVDRLLGDGLFALFGARHAAEDAPERAVRAGLRICDAVRALGQDATVGINTGSAYLGPVGSSAYAEHTAMGSTVNLAARLRAAAEPGQVVVGRSTRAATRGRVDYQPTTIDAKGLGRVEAFRVIGLETGRRVRGFEGRTSEIVGRAPERHALADALDDLRQGRGGISFVIGESGLGKTRLVDELAERARALDVATIQARCEESNPASYGPWIEALRQVRATSETASASSIDTRFLTGEATEDEAAELRDLAPVALRNRLLRSLEQLWLDVAHERPTLLVLEDLHWADALSITVLERVMTHVPACPLLVVATQRPELDQPSAQLPERATHASPDHLIVLRLHELPPADANHLLARLLGLDQADDIGSALGVERAQGNPLFVEELVAAAVDAGILEPSDHGWTLSSPSADPTELAVPDTLQTIVLSRVDRLEPDLQQTLRTASVLGRTFALDELDLMPGGPVSFAHLDELERRGLVFRDDTRPEPSYTFKHALVHETIYSSILRRHREPLHRAAALAIEQCRGTDGAADRLAQQWDATTDDASAFTALSRAAAIAHRTFELDAALRFLDRAALRAERLDLPADARAELDERRGDLLELAGQHAAARAGYAAAARCLDGSDDAVAARLLRKEGHCWTIEHDYDGAERAYERAGSLLDQIPERDDELVARAPADRGRRSAHELLAQQHRPDGRARPHLRRQHHRARHDAPDRRPPHGAHDALVANRALRRRRPDPGAGRARGEGSRRMIPISPIARSWSSTTASACSGGATSARPTGCCTSRSSWRSARVTSSPSRASTPTWRFGRDSPARSKRAVRTPTRRSR